MISSPSLSRYYKDGGACKQCSADCALCTSAASCDSCGNNKFLAVESITDTTIGMNEGRNCWPFCGRKNGDCVAYCGTGGKCCKKGQVGGSCSGSEGGSSGHRCVAGEQPVRVLCASTCPAGTFEQGASVTGRTCVACLSDCAACADTSTCQTCGKSKYLSVDSTSCPTACPTKTYGNGAGITGRTCENCTAGCSLCTGGSTCDECTAPLLLDQGTCVSSCSDGYVHREGEQPCLFPSIFDVVSSRACLLPTDD